MSVGEHVRGDNNLFAGRALDWEAAAVDLGPDAFHDQTTLAGVGTRTVGSLVGNRGVKSFHQRSFIPSLARRALRSSPPSSTCVLWQVAVPDDLRIFRQRETGR